MRVLSSFFTALTVLVAGPFLRADAPVLKAGDVIAFVGGEDMVVAAEYGRLELLLVRALPGHGLKFRSLAWEGDTVFAQWRELNYPTLEQQLDEIAATVVIAQFGQMESMAGPARLREFTAAYEKLIDRIAGGGKRRVVLLGPTPVSGGLPASSRFKSIEAYADAVREVAGRRGLPCIIPDDGPTLAASSYWDGLHLNEEGHNIIAARVASLFGVKARPDDAPSTDELRLADAIRAKNRLWFHYARPQNWAFLNGDRTVQPSSRDHIDPSKRWFPEEMKRWLPLVAAKEAEIQALAAKAAGGASTKETK
ncbi:MAG: GDSL-type esterase/lipase family protein [Chthoniobacteraceae bacterium]